MAKIKANKIISAINKVISVNPTEITFTKKIKKIVDGAFEEEEIIKTITVLIYLDDSSNLININSDNQGTSYSTNRYKMIADKNSELDATPKENIKFSSNRDSYEIKAVYPQVIEDIICGYICDLERID